jgi:hypothetical protein
MLWNDIFAAGPWDTPIWQDNQEVDDPKFDYMLSLEKMSVRLC